MVVRKNIGLWGLIVLIVGACSVKIPISSHHDCGKIPIKVYAELMTDAASLTGHFTEDVYRYMKSNYDLDTSIYFSSTFTAFKKDTSKLLFHYDSILYDYKGSLIRIKPASYCNWRSSLSFDSFEYEVWSQVQRMDNKELYCFIGNYMKSMRINVEGDSISSFTLLESIRSCK